MNDRDDDMRYKLRKAHFEKVSSRCVAELFGPLGFAETDPGAFTRPVEKILQGFGFTLHSSYPQFCVPVGISVPCLRRRMEHVMKGHYPALTVSRRLGEFRNDGSGIEQWYSVSSDEELPMVLQLVHEHFTEQALPWFEQFVTLDSVSAEFYRRRIAPLPTGEKRRLDPFAFAAYGWMLEELGNVEESEKWLVSAASEISKPIYMKNGRVIDQNEPGATQLKKSDEEERLMQLLDVQPRHSL